MDDKCLAGQAILVAEDEYLIASDLRRELNDQGAIVLGPASSLEMTLRLVEREPRIDAAVLDINLRGEWIFAAADVLARRGVPFVFATGYDPSVVPDRFAAVPRCEKPSETGRVSSVLCRVMGGATARPAAG